MQLLRISFLTFSKAVSLAESLCTEMTVNRVLPTAISETVQGLPSYVPTAALIGSHAFFNNGDRFYGIPAHESGIEQLERNISHTAAHGEALLQRFHADGRAVYDPVVPEVTE